MFYVILLVVVIVAAIQRCCVEKICSFGAACLMTWLMTWLMTRKKQGEGRGVYVQWLFPANKAIAPRTTTTTTTTTYYTHRISSSRVLLLFTSRLESSPSLDLIKTGYQLVDGSHGNYNLLVNLPFIPGSRSVDKLTPTRSNTRTLSKE